MHPTGTEDRRKIKCLQLQDLIYKACRNPSAPYRVIRHNSLVTSADRWIELHIRRAEQFSSQNTSVSLDLFDKIANHLYLEPLNFALL